MKGTRADVRLVELGLCQSREKARSLIMSGAVYINEVRIDKAGDAVPEDCVLTVRENPIFAYNRAKGKHRVPYGTEKARGRFCYNYAGSGGRNCPEYCEGRA